jgi:hypothetical protein
MKYWTTLSLSILFTSGCAQFPRTPFDTSAVYPICFYDVELGAVNTARASWPTQSNKLVAALASITGSKELVTVVSSHNIVVVTEPYKQKRIMKIWPNIACIGESGGDASSRRRNICINYIREQLKATQRKEPIGADIPAPTCQTFF